jgi:hypothetical protein
MFLGNNWLAVAGAAIWCSVAVSAVAQPKQLTKDNYAQAEKFMDYNVNPLVYHTVEHLKFMPDGRFWYRDRAADGVTFELVDPLKGTKTAAFDQQKVATALSEALGGMAFDARHLPVTEIALEDGDRVLLLNTPNETMRCELSEPVRCAVVSVPVKDGVAATLLAERQGVAEADISPDGRKIAFIRDYNLWVRDMTTGKETRLTKDGVKDFGYATDNAGWQQSDSAVLVWSPDSKKIATFQQDQRRDGEMYLVPVTNGHPNLKAWKYPLAGDANVTMIERVIIDVDRRKVIRLKMPADQHR